VRQAWEIIRRRVSQKNPKAASCLQDFRVVTVEHYGGPPVVVIQAEHQPHYNFLNQGNRHKPVEQALELEFGIKCLVRLLPPGQPSGTTLLERATLRRDPSLSTLTGTTPSQVPEAASSPDSPAAGSAEASPLARNGTLTENDRGSGRPETAEPPSPGAQPEPAADRQHEPPASSRSTAFAEKTPQRAAPATDQPRPQSNGFQPEPAALREKASSDPRVQEVIKTFNAEIIDIDIDKSE
jgi:hypothetical protein